MTYDEILAAVAAKASAGKANSTTPFVYPKDLTAKPFRIVDVAEAKGYKGKQVVRFTIQHKGDKAPSGLLDMSVTERSKLLLALRDELVKAEGFMVTAKRHLDATGVRFAWDLVKA